MHVATQNRIRTTFHRSASLLAIEHTAEIINLGHKANAAAPGINVSVI